MKTTIQNLILEKEVSMASAVEEISVATGIYFQNYIVSVFRKKKEIETKRKKTGDNIKLSRASFYLLI